MQQSFATPGKCLDLGETLASNFFLEEDLDFFSQEDLVDFCEELTSLAHNTNRWSHAFVFFKLGSILKGSSCKNTVFKESAIFSLFTKILFEKCWLILRFSKELMIANWGSKETNFFKIVSSSGKTNAELTEVFNEVENILK